jgi:hypothetical protein
MTGETGVSGGHLPGMIDMACCAIRLEVLSLSVFSPVFVVGRFAVDDRLDLLFFEMTGPAVHGHHGD